MRLATWNVNSLRVRLEQVRDWCARQRPDLLALQETKLEDGAFPAEALREAGYRSLFAGQKTYNGVAILYRGDVEPQAVVTDLPGLDDPQRRLLAATFGDLRLVNVYVPNGAAVGSDKFAYKLDWLARLRDFLAAELARHERLAVVGDFNIAPEDRDVHDPELWAGAVLVSPLERAAYRELLALGLHDAFRLFDQPEASYSWWDYRAGAFRRNHGLRIDHILVSEALRRRCTACFIDREPRAWQRPSDHTPVVADFDAVNEIEQ